jgi:hypothetical protein
VVDEPEDVIRIIKDFYRKGKAKKKSRS